jgi:FkbH-like protein
MVIGQCLMAGWSGVLKQIVPGVECDFYLSNNSQMLPEMPPHPAAEYDFQLVHVPLRSVVPDGSYFRLSYADIDAYERLFAEACERLGQFLATSMRWNREQGILTFVANFTVPQLNPMGRLLPRYDLRNFVYFVERLNQRLAEELQAYSNAYLFDFDQLVATHGRKYCQDDSVMHIGHGAALADLEADKEMPRLEPLPPLRQVYCSNVNLFLQLGWQELLAMYRTIRQIDMVKLVVFDIDDTLWRGVAADQNVDAVRALEGWPLGIAEAIGHLKRRGILLAVVSKNEATIIEPIWQRLFGPRLSLNDFAIRKINWKTKVENFEEILQTLNLLPRNVVFVDDNPVERAAIKSAFPDVRTIGPNPYVWRRILLWSAETQVAAITHESASRTNMMQAQIARETERKTMSREEFLASLQVRVKIRELGGVEDRDFTRALELINKTNQFNTTGRRWTHQECQAAITNSVRFFVVDVRDRFTEYGVVGVAILRRNFIKQFVMSCRVLGMDVEIGVIAELLRLIIENANVDSVQADLQETELNLAVRDLWARCGFKKMEQGWNRAAMPALERPPHITFDDGGILLKEGSSGESHLEFFRHLGVVDE